MEIRDERALKEVQQKLGGSLKKRSGTNSFRYRLHNQPGMLLLLEMINGEIRNTKRVVQLEAMCKNYDIPYKEPSALTIDNS